MRPFFLLKYIYNADTEIKSVKNNILFKNTLGNIWNVLKKTISLQCLK